MLDSTRVSSDGTTSCGGISSALIIVKRLGTVAVGWGGGWWVVEVGSWKRLEVWAVTCDQE